MDPINLSSPLPTLCPKCHQVIEVAAYFCPNCGQNLKPTPPSTSLGSQLELYLKSLLLPPMGIIWGFRYLRQKGISAKIVGLMAIFLTLAILVIAIKATVDLVNTVNSQINSQMSNMWQ